MQDAFLHWRAADRQRIKVPEAWLTKAITNLCLDRLRQRYYEGNTVWRPSSTRGCRRPSCNGGSRPTPPPGLPIRQ